MATELEMLEGLPNNGFKILTVAQLEESHVRTVLQFRLDRA